MLIVSNFRDYYDKVNAFGVDKNIVYNRYTVKYEKPSYNLRYGLFEKDWFEFCVLFCGKKYIGLKILNDGKDNHYYNEDIDLFLRKEEETRASKLKKRYIFNRFNTLEYLTEKFSKIDETYHIKYKSPILLFKITHFIVNPILQEIDFQKQKNPHQAFQEIQTYISGEEFNNKSLIEVSDMEKIEGHGFDRKWSFRNPEPPSRKIKKK